MQTIVLFLIYIGKFPYSMSLVQYYRNIIKSRLLNQSKTFFVVVGPCSIQNEEEARVYEEKLCNLQKELGNSIFLVMRAFVEKSRTSFNWRGFVYRPDKAYPENIIEGLKRSKALFSSLSMPLAMEFVDPSIYPHLEPYISWGFIGARTATSTPHRVLVSNSKLPFGFKNSLDGDVSSAIYSCAVAKQPHCMLTPEGQFFSKGNPFAHVVLRGGKNECNYTLETIEQTIKNSLEEGITTPILIDCSHGNCPNKPLDQTIAFNYTLDTYLDNPEKILGVMLESNIYEGAQKDKVLFGVSSTDPCLNFETTKALLLDAKEKILLRHRKVRLVQPTSYVYNH
jgi:3-deoxy-7-phosphoheptulonate synthase